jgi:hypothetical protein
VRIEDILLALDWAEEELVSKGPGRVRGADRGEGA